MHQLPVKPALLLAASLLTMGASGQATWTLNATAGYPFLEEWLLDDWKSAFADHVNASGAVNITGYDVSRPYSEKSKSKDWQYTVEVQTDMQVVEDSESGSIPGRVITGIWIKMSVPQELLLPIPDGEPIGPRPDDDWKFHMSQDRQEWEVCRLLYLAPGLRSEEPIEGPGCGGFLSEQCIEDWSRVLEDGFGAHPDPENRPPMEFSRCPLPRPRDIPASCNGTGMFARAVGTGIGRFLFFFLFCFFFFLFFFMAKNSFPGITALFRLSWLVLRLRHSG